MPEPVVRNVAEYLAALQQLRLTGAERSHVRWWFRGQPDRTWPLVPGVYRREFPTGPGPDPEAGRLRVEQHLYQDFRVLSAGLIDRTPTAVELYFLLQHYGMPTRLLDWTTNPLAALYFTANAGPGVDGRVVLMDVLELRPGAGERGPPAGVLTSDDPRLAEMLAPVVGGGTPDGFCDYVVPIRPSLFNTRLRLQRGCFTLHVPGRPEMTPEVNPSLLSIVVPGDAKPTIYDELRLIGVDEFTIYGDLDNLAVSLKAAYRLV